MIDFSGFQMPVQYTSIIKEHEMVRSSAGLFDASHMGEFLIRGSETVEFLQYLLTNNMSDVKVGKVVYSPMCNEKGGVIDDLLAYRLGEEEYLLVVNASNKEKDWKHVVKVAEKFDGVTVKDNTDQTSLLALQGPESEAILQQLTEVELKDLPYYFCCQGEVLDYEVLLSRTGYTGEDGFELYVKNEEAPVIWKALLERGEEHGLNPAGLGARDTLRLEAGYPLYGNEFDEETPPLLAGLKWTIDFDKGDFIGREALKEVLEQGLDKKLIGLELLERGIPRSHYPVFVSGEEAGEITSGTFSPSLKKSIGMAYVPSSYDGEELLVKIRKNKVEAREVKLPFVDLNVKSG